MNSPVDLLNEIIRTSEQRRPDSLRGLICIDRMHNGVLTTFPLSEQWKYAEFVGCYSLTAGGVSNE